MRRLLVVLVAFASTGSLLAVDYERRLIPIAVSSAPGAYGSVWTTRAEAVQQLQWGVEIVGDMRVFHEVPGFFGMSQPYPISPLPSQDEPPGAIMHIRKEGAHAVHISARLIVQRGTTILEETVIPVVSESEFVDSTLYFLQLVNDSRERRHLRVYSLDLDHPRPEVRVRIQATWLGNFRGWHFVYDEVHALNVQQKYVAPTMLDGGGPRPVRPLALELSLEPILDTLPDDALLAVSVLPASPDLRIWAMLSETNNVTQRLRIVLPE